MLASLLTSYRTQDQDNKRLLFSDLLIPEVNTAELSLHSRWEEHVDQNMLL